LQQQAQEKEEIVYINEYDEDSENGEEENGNA
jgi:hypothetical protein